MNNRSRLEQTRNNDILVYAPLPVEEVPQLRQQDANLASSGLQRSVPSPVGKKKKLPPIEGKAQVEDILKYIFPPRRVELEGKEFLQFVSSQ